MAFECEKSQSDAICFLYAFGVFEKFLFGLQ